MKDAKGKADQRLRHAADRDKISTCSSSAALDRPLQRHGQGGDDLPTPSPARSRAADGSTSRTAVVRPNTAANAIGMFDPKTRRSRSGSATPWSMPTTSSRRSRRAWTGSMFNDQVARLDSKSGDIVSICCRAAPISGASSMMIGQGCGREQPWVPPSSSWRRWIDLRDKA